MPVVGSMYPTLADWASRLDSEGKVSAVVNLLEETNEILEDMAWVEGNLPTGHMTTVATGLPSVTWRTLYKGIQPSKGATAQVTDTCGMLEARAIVDADLAQLNGNSAAWRLSEERLFLEAMNQEMAKTLFYGDIRQNPERFMGLHPRFADPTAKTWQQVIDAGGTGNNNTSIWLVCWGDNTVHGIFPKGSKAGLQIEDRGRQTITDADGGRFDVLETKYKWDCGLTVRDWRYVVRIANVDVNALQSGSGAADLPKLLTMALEMLPSTNLGRPVFYCHRKVRTALRLQIFNKANVNLSFDEGARGGKKVLAFDGVPVRRCDQLLITESRIA